MGGECGFDGSAVEDVSCNSCDAIWRNVYDFSAVELLDEVWVLELRQEATTGNLDMDAIVKVAVEQPVSE